MGKQSRIQYDPSKMPGPAPYITVEEMQKNPALIDPLIEDDGGPRWTHGTEPELFKKYAPPSANKRVLDVGTMHGRFLQWFQDEGYEEVHGVDFVDMNKYGDKNRYTFHALDMNFEKLPYPDGYFDAISSWGLFEHMDNPYFLMRECHRVLKKDGILIVSWPNIENIISRLVLLKNGDLRQYEKHNNHIAVFSKGIFAKTFGRYFDVVLKTFLPGTISLPPYKIWNALIAPLIPKRTPLTGHHVIYVLRKKPFVPYV